jgi:undecaprenyl diphosphate synthase
MALFRRYLVSEAKELQESGVCVRFIGDRGPLNSKLVDLMSMLERETAGNTRLSLNIALNYGSRDEIAHAVRCVAQAVAAGEVDPAASTPDLLGSYLYTSDLPDPDLVIRTSGETRISNFLLWQSAYAEYEFTPVLWPDFTTDHFADILLAFSGRERRFGAVLP